MNEKNDVVKLTSTEISTLWTTYMNDSTVLCLIVHFIKTCSDPEMLEILQKAETIAKNHMNTVEQLFHKEEIVVPEAFPVEKHVVPNAPKLFTDIFFMQCLLQMCKFAVDSHSACLTSSARADVRKLYNDFLNDTLQLFNELLDCMQSKGIYVRMPNMTYPSEIEFINKEKFLTGWFGRRRSLLGIEVSHLMENVFQNEMGKSICIGFSQVAREKEIRDYFLRGKNLSKQIISSINDVLVESDVPKAGSWDQGVTNSTVAPFSDQLMLFIIGILSNLALLTHGAGLSGTMRRDIIAMYANLITKIGAFGEDGVNLMIERRWLEQPPQFDDHDRLAKGK